MASLRQSRAAAPESRGWEQVQQWIKMADAVFPVKASALIGAGSKGPEGPDFSEVYETNGIVFACMAARQRVFSQVVWRFAAINNGKVGRLFGTPDLDILSKPWPGGTAGDLATRMILDADTKGAFFGVKQGNRIYRRDPNKVDIALNGNPKEDEFVDIVGFTYRPGGKQGPVYTYTPDQVAYWTPHLDPDAPYQKGISWVTPVLREIASDNAANLHKADFFETGTPQMVVKTPESVMTQDQFNEFKAKMDATAASAGKNGTLYLVPGVDVEVVGRNFEQMDFSNTQGRDETRIASAAGVPAVILGLKESLAGSSLNQGNYQAARRAFADMTMTHLYQSAASALEVLVAPPTDKGPAKLWFDISQVPFFHEDRSDAADIQQKKATTIKTLIDAAWKPESVRDAVEQEDFTQLVHTGLSTVQVQPTTPGSAA